MNRNTAHRFTGTRFTATRFAFGAASLALAAALVQPATAHAQDAPAEATRSYNMPAQDLGKALRDYGKQSGRQIIFTPDLVRGKRAPALSGDYTAPEALDRILRGSGLHAEVTPAGAVMIMSPPGETLAAAGNASGRKTASSYGVEALRKGVAEILVVGRRTLNADVRRTEDDVQPYVVFNSDDIDRSGAASAADFLASRLPMNAQSLGIFQASESNSAGQASTQGAIALRGLSPSQTLILVDGRRIAGAALGNVTGLGQPNIAGIPASAIERIEVLPATAGGIYGGGAIGGAINIILKQNYSGVDATVKYGNTFDGASSSTLLSISGGFAPDSDTNVMFRLSTTREGALEVSDRPFQSQAYQTRFRNNPTSFGSPPAGSTPNICAAASANRCSSSPLVFDDQFGGSSLNSSITSIPSNFAGIDTDGISPLTQSDAYNFAASPRAGLLRSPQRSDAYALSASRTIGSILKAYFDIQYNEIAVQGGKAEVDVTGRFAADDPGNPYQQDILVTVPISNLLYDFQNKSKNASAIVGITAYLGNNWAFSAEQKWSRSSRSQELSRFSFPAIPSSMALRDTTAYPVDLDSLIYSNTTTIDRLRANLSDSVIRLSGPIAKIPAGKIVFSGYFEFRKENIPSSVKSTLQDTTSGNTYTWRPARSQEVRSVYGELRIPLVASSSKLPFLNSLEAFAALRHDIYKTDATEFGPGGSLASGFDIPSPNGPFPTYESATNRFHSTDYTVGIQVSPISGLMLRGSYATGFLPPNLGQIVSSTTLYNAFFASIITGPDPMRGNTRATTPVTIINGGNFGLTPEISKSFSFGAVVSPRFIPGLRLSLDFVSIRKNDEITAITNIPLFVQREGDFPGRVVRGENLPTDQPGWAGPITTLDATALNIARTKVDAIDLKIDFEIDGGRLGSFHPYLLGTNQIRLSRKILPTDVFTSTVGYLDGPLKWRGNVGLDWESGAWSAGWNGQYFSSYRICNSVDTEAACDQASLSQGSQSVPSQFYNDFYLEYRFTKEGAESRQFLAGARIRLAIQNAFERRPPIVTNSGVGYSTYADPRLRRFQVSVSKSF